MNVLVFTPTYHVDGVEQLRPETEASIRALEWDGRVEWEVGWHNPHENGPDNVLAQYQRARKVFLKGKWDLLFTVEHDMIAPPGALRLLNQALVELGAGVAYGVYILRRSRSVNVWARAGSKVGLPMERAPGGLLEDYLRRAAVVEVGGIGFGATLFKRETLKQVEFSYDQANQWPSPDIPFARDCLRLGIVQAAHFGVICGHIDADGTVLWPDERKFEMANVRVKILVTFEHDGTKYRGGSEAVLGSAQAHEWQKQGRLRIISALEAPRVKITQVPELSRRRSAKKRPKADGDGG